MSEAEKVEEALNSVETHKPVRGSVKLPFDASKIQWQQRQGEKGPFELSEDFNSPDHKALLKFLNEYAGGCINSEGFFYWVFPSGSTIGRKQKKARGQ